MAITNRDGIHILDLSDGRVTLILPTLTDSDIRGITWAPDGTTLVFPTFSFGASTQFIREWKLHTVSSEGTELSLMYDRMGPEAHPAYGPDGRLAYWGQRGLYINGLAVWEWPWIESEMRLTWSTDGGSIVFARSVLLTRIDLADTSQTEDLYREENQRTVADPEYSPDGTQIAFIKIQSPTNSEVWVVDADGTDEYRLTTGFLDTKPVWGPDGTTIAFVRNQANIYYVDSAPGSGPHLVITHPVEHLAWWTQ